MSDATKEANRRVNDEIAAESQPLVFFRQRKQYTHESPAESYDKGFKAGRDAAFETLMEAIQFAHDMRPIYICCSNKHDVDGNG